MKIIGKNEYINREIQDLIEYLNRFQIIIENIKKSDKIEISTGIYEYDILNYKFLDKYPFEHNTFTQNEIKNLVKNKMILINKKPNIQKINKEGLISLQFFPCRIKYTVNKNLKNYKFKIICENDYEFKSLYNYINYLQNWKLKVYKISKDSRIVLWPDNMTLKNNTYYTLERNAKDILFDLIYEKFDCTIKNN